MTDLEFERIHQGAAVIQDEDKLCGFDFVKIKRSDFSMELRDVFGASIKDEEREGDTPIILENGGYYFVYSLSEGIYAEPHANRRNRFVILFDREMMIVSSFL